jgi:two-component system LytT family response regulator
MKTRVLIVDDEELARRGVAIRLLEHPDMVVVGECADGDEAIQSVSTLRPDLIFLDVQMPGMSGIEMLRSLPDRLSIPAIIFLTAYDEYALAAFEVQALDYLLKPIDDERFAASLERARRLLVLEQQETLYTRMLGLLEMRSEDAGPGPVKRFAVRTGKHVSFVQSDDIDWVESIGDYAGLHVGTKHIFFVSRSTSLNQDLITSGFSASIDRLLCNWIALHVSTHCPIEIASSLFVMKPRFA